MKIIVLAGGLSTERDVSLASAAGICRTLIEKGHDAFLLEMCIRDSFYNNCSFSRSLTIDRRCHSGSPAADDSDIIHNFHLLFSCH